MVKPRYRVVAIDETRNWAPEIVAITGRIAGVYLINFAEVIHIGSVRGSYWAEFVCNITENYVREPDGYSSGKPVWDEEWAAEYPEDFARSVALVEAWEGRFYGITYEGAGESSHYLDEGFPEPEGNLIHLVDWDDAPCDPDDRDEYRKQCDEAAMDAVQYLMANGEEWQDLAPWAK